MQHPEHLHAGGELLIMPSYQVEIPRTTPQLYITGIYALNVQCPEGTTGDQHDVFHWFYRPGIREEAPTVTLGGSDELDTNAIYGDLGVYEGRERLLAKGLNIAPEIREVYVANHYRAILDLLYESLTHYGRVYNLTGAKQALGTAPVVGSIYQASVAFHTSRVFKATGSTTFYYSEAKNDPQYQRSLVNYRHYYVVLPKKVEAIGAIISDKK